MKAYSQQPFFSEIRILILFFMLPLLGACGGGGSSSSDGTQSAEPTQVTISGLDSAAPVVVGQSTALTPNATFADGTTAELSNGQVQWQTSDDSIVAVDTDGTLRALAPGTAEVVVTHGGLSASTTVEVVARQLDRIALQADTNNAPLGTNVELRVFGIFNDNTRESLGAEDGINLSSSNPVVADFGSAVFGQLQTATIGTTEVTATLSEGISDRISIEVTPASLSNILLSASALTTPAGVPVQLNALGTFTDGTQTEVTNSVTWVADPAADVVITQSGEMTAAEAGLVTVEATFNGVTSSIEIDVTEAVLEGVEVVAGDGSVPLGQTASVELRGLFSDGTESVVSAEEWQAANPAILTINGEGVITSVSVGATTISGSRGTFSATAPFEVTAAVLESILVSIESGSPATLPVGLQTTATAEGRFSDGSSRDISDQVVWSSSAASVASIDATGAISGVAVGSTEVVATLGGATGSASLAVTDAVIESVQIAASSLSGGQISAPRGLTEVVELIGTLSDGSETTLSSANVEWAVSNPAIATVAASGEVQFLSVGTATLTGTSAGFSDSVLVTTTEAVPVSLDITGAESSVAAGVATDLSAVAVFSDASTSDVTATAAWSSSDPTVAVVVDGGANSGRLQPSEAGSVTVTAEATVDGVALSGSLALTVSPSTLEISRESGLTGGFSICGGVGSAQSSACFISSTQNLSVVPAPTWFTVDRYRLRALGRDWTIDDVTLTEFGVAATRVVGLQSGDVISAGAVVEIEIQIQSTTGILEEEIFALDAIDNDGSSTRGITGFYSVTTN